MAVRRQVVVLCAGAFVLAPAIGPVARAGAPAPGMPGAVFAADSGPVLMKQAASLEAAGNHAAAAQAYQRAARAFDAAGQREEHALALQRATQALRRAAGLPASNLEPGAGTPAPAAAGAGRGAGLHLPPLKPKPGYVIGRAVFEDGRPIPRFTVSALGFDGQVFVPRGGLPFLGKAEGANGQYELRTLDTVRQQRPVNAMVRAVRAQVKLAYNGHNYEIELHPLDGKRNGTGADDFQGESGKGVVRDFVLKMSGLKPGYTGQETGETNFKNAEYGGRIPVDGTLPPGPQYQGVNDPALLVNAFPKGSTVEVKLTPAGPLLDGSQGQTIVRTFPLGADWQGGSYLRGIPLGVYTATARLADPNGASYPLRVSLVGTIPVAWQPSVRIEFPPTEHFPDGSTEVPLHLAR